ncbi:hypothetical protein GN956_G12801 [Arapaima gigas]
MYTKPSVPQRGGHFDPHLSSSLGYNQSNTEGQPKETTVRLLRPDTTRSEPRFRREKRRPLARLSCQCSAPEKGMGGFRRRLNQGPEHLPTTSLAMHKDNKERGCVVAGKQRAPGAPK